MQTYEINGKEFEITGYARLKDKDGNPSGEVVPVIDIPQISDYEYQLINLKSRIEHPEYYQEIENVPEVMKRLKTWLLKKTTTHLYLQFYEKYKACYDFFFAKEAKVVWTSL